MEIVRSNHWANMLLGIPFGATGAPTKVGIPLRPLNLNDFERMQIAAFLRGHANNLSEPPKNAGRKRDRAAAERDYSLAFDYELARERGEKGGEPTYRTIGDYWGIGWTVVRDAYQTYRHDDHWKWWVDYVRNLVKLENPNTIDLNLEISKFLRSTPNWRQIARSR